MWRVTVVNDNPDFLDLMSAILEDGRYEATTIDGDLPEALQLIRSSRPDALMIDLRLGSDGMHGWRIAQEVRRDAQLGGVPILVCSGDIPAMQELGEQLGETQSVELLAKPFAIDDLTSALDRLLTRPGADESQAPRSAA